MSNEKKAMDNDKVVFTDAAVGQIEKFKDEQVERLVKAVIENKKFPGSDFIEITASDIQEGARRLSAGKPVSKSIIQYFVVYSYLFIGLSLILVGLFYQNITFIYENNPKQFLYIVTGFATTALSGILALYIRQSERKRMDELVKYSEIVNFEKIQIEEMSKFYESLSKHTQGDKPKEIV